jgi:hypothetical protein
MRLTAGASTTSGLEESLRSNSSPASKFSAQYRNKYNIGEKNYAKK